MYDLDVPGILIVTEYFDKLNRDYKSELTNNSLNLDDLEAALVNLLEFSEAARNEMSRILEIEQIRRKEIPPPNFTSFSRHLMSSNLMTFSDLVKAINFSKRKAINFSKRFVFGNDIENAENNTKSKLNPLTFLRNHQSFLDFLIQNNKLTKDDIEDIFNNIYTKSDLESFDANKPLVQFVLENNMISNKSLIDKYGDIGKLFAKPNLIAEILKNDKLTYDDVQHLLSKLTTSCDCHDFLSWVRHDNLYRDTNESVVGLNKELFRRCHDLDESFFQKLVDSCRNILDDDGDCCLYEVLYIDLDAYSERDLGNDDVSSSVEMLKNEMIKLTNSLDSSNDIANVSLNTSLMKVMLNEWQIDPSLILKAADKLSKSANAQKENVHDLFDLLEYSHREDKEFLKELNLDSYRFVYSLSSNVDELTEISEILKNSETARIQLKNLVEVNAHDQYDFESLKSLLSKYRSKMKGIFNF